jgi:ketosteroid isomerase-like protein
MEAADRTGASTPAPGLNRTALALIEATLRAVEAKDLAGIRALVAEDAVMIDPHYPVTRMVGWPQIGDGLRWSFGTIDTFRFRVVHGFESADGAHAAVEVACAHILRGVRPLAFQQTFVADVREGRITRLQAYEPYGPGGLVGWVLRLTRLLRQLRGRRPWPAIAPPPRLQRVRWRRQGSSISRS